MVTDLLDTLVKLRVIQFGQFEIPARPGTFAPISLTLGLLPSYPAALRELARELAPLVRPAGSTATHLLAMPTAVPLGVAVALETGMPLVYPSALDPKTIEGAYDFNESTVLLSSVFSDGSAERAMIKHVKPLGLDVKAVVAAISLHCRGNDEIDGLPRTAWGNLDDLLPRISGLTPSMRQAVTDWLIQVA